MAILGGLVFLMSEVPLYAGARLATRRAAAGASPSPGQTKRIQLKAVKESFLRQSKSPSFQFKAVRVSFYSH